MSMPKKTDVINVSIAEQYDTTEVELEYKPNEVEQNVITSTFLKFRLSADDRNRAFEYLDGDDLITYINDSVRRFVTNYDEREDIEDWQSRINDQFTRNKVLGILAKVVRVLPIAQMTARGDEDFNKSLILSNLYEYAEDLDDYEEFMVFYLLEAIVKGTAIGYEGLERKTKLVRNVENANDDITIKEVSETTSKLFAQIVPLEDFYPQNVGIRNIKSMVYCFWRENLPLEKFKANWGMYDKAQYVLGKGTSQGKDQDKPFYADTISSDIPEGNVEVIKYYNSDVDEYIVIANGVWLNPLTNKSGGLIISPIPFNHKELPFFDVKFDFFGSDFFYGKSLPDRLKSLQDVLNVLTNMLLDQSFLTIFPPMLTNGFDSIEDDYLRPGRRTPIDTQGLPIDKAFMKLDLGTPSGWHQYILNYTRQIMEQASLDQVSSGTAGQGDRTTAREINVAADGVASMLGLFGRMINYGLKRKALFKGANILQFWTDPKTPVFAQVGGEEGDKEFSKAFNTFKINNTVLSNGKRGTKIIEMYQNKSDMPTKSKTKARALISQLEHGKNIEVVTMETSYLRNYQFDIKIVPNQKSDATRDMDKAMQLEKDKTYLTLFPDLVNREELLAQTAEKMGDDPAKIIKAEVLNPNPNPQMAAPGQDQAGGAPKSGTGMQQNLAGTNQDIKASSNLKDLLSSMTG
jgi:hypothetical protein